LVKAIAGSGRGEQARVRFGDADDLNLRTVQRLAEESVDVSMDQADDADAEWRMCGRLRERKHSREQNRQNAETHNSVHGFLRWSSQT
jgi:hypothetical protein